MSRGRRRAATEVLEVPVRGGPPWLWSRPPLCGLSKQIAVSSFAIRSGLLQHLLEKQKLEAELVQETIKAEIQIEEEEARLANEKAEELEGLEKDHESQVEGLKSTLDQGAQRQREEREKIIDEKSVMPGLTKSSFFSFSV